MNDKLHMFLIKATQVDFHLTNLFDISKPSIIYYHQNLGRLLDNHVDFCLVVYALTTETIMLAMRTMLVVMGTMVVTKSERHNSHGCRREA